MNGPERVLAVQRCALRQAPKLPCAVGWRSARASGQCAGHVILDGSLALRTGTRLQPLLQQSCARCIRRSRSSCCSHRCRCCWTAEPVVDLEAPTLSASQTTVRAQRVVNRGNRTCPCRLRLDWATNSSEVTGLRWMAKRGSIPRIDSRDRDAGAAIRLRVCPSPNLDTDEMTPDRLLSALLWPGKDSKAVQ